MKPNYKGHQIFVEPMGRHTNEMYLQGFSTSLPEEVQIRMVRSLPGLSGAVIQRPAYAIEYDLVDPLSLKATLESKIVPCLFTAGQINGSSGYEEAAGQGIVAGINAAMKVLGRKPVIIDRSQGYIGVLIDDLVTKGTNEPYRMFTSRAEHRLLMRQDNAAFRMAGAAGRLGILAPERLREVREFQRQIDEETARLSSTLRDGATLAQWIKRNDQTYASVVPDSRLPEEVVTQVEFNLKYAGYIEREWRQVEKAAQIAKQKIPDGFDFNRIPALRYETREKLNQVHPADLGQASRVSGVTPADIAILSVWLKAKGGE